MVGFALSGRSSTEFQPVLEFQVVRNGLAGKGIVGPAVALFPDSHLRPTDDESMLVQIPRPKSGEENRSDGGFFCRTKVRGGLYFAEIPVNMRICKRFLVFCGQST